MFQTFLSPVIKSDYLRFMRSVSAFDVAVVLV